MQSGGIEGLAETYSLFGRITDSAREQLAVEEASIGYDVLAAQKRDVAKDTGALEAGLSLQLQVAQLRVRVGLLLAGTASKAAHRISVYYGRFVEFGRHAQVVLVQRRRRVGGKLRLGPGRRKRLEDIASTYSMKVSALPPRPFVHVDRPEIHAEQRLAEFWSQVLSNAGAGN